MRLKALLVDDEINILRNLQQVLPWEAEQVELVGMAKNGVQAMEMVHAHQPHLIFCDIRMPIMDGIAFLQELRDVDEEAEVIMLTGYQEFEYARSVLRFRVMDYVLKPIDYDALEQLFIKATQHIRGRLAESRRSDEVLHRMQDIAFEKVLLDYIHGFHREGKQHVHHEGVEMQTKAVLFALESTQLPLTANLLNAFEPVLKELGQHFDGRTCMLHVGDRFWAVLLIGSLGCVDHEQLKQMMDKLSEPYSGQTGLSIAAYERVLDLEELHDVWTRLCRELSFAKQRYLIVGEEDDVQYCRNDQKVWQCTDDCIAAIKHMDQAAARKSLHRLNQLLREHSSQSLQQVEKLINAIIVYMLRELRRFDAISLMMEEEIWQQLKSTCKLQEMIVLISSMVEAAFTEHVNKRPQVSIHVAKDYIETHLSKDIAAEEVALYLNISVSYFSTIFKQHYGMTFIDFVTQTRIERAKSLLRMTKKSISDIARAVGYTERRYFNKVFQKREGMLPSEYRERYAPGNEGIKHA